MLFGWLTTELIMEIKTSLSITIEEADLKKAIINLIKEHNPNIVVEDIDFVAKRNPKCIETSVTAHLGDGTITAKTKPQPKVSNEAIDMVDELDKPEPKEEPKKADKTVKEKSEPVKEEEQVDIDDLLGDDDEDDSNGSLEKTDMSLIDETLEEDAKNSGGGSLEDFLDDL